MLHVTQAAVCVASWEHSRLFPAAGLPSGQHGADKAAVGCVPLLWLSATKSLSVAEIRGLELPAQALEDVLPLM